MYCPVKTTPRQKNEGTLERAETGPNTCHSVVQACTQRNSYNELYHHKGAQTIDTAKHPVEFTCSRMEEKTCWYTNPDWKSLGAYSTGSFFFGCWKHLKIFLEPKNTTMLENNFLGHLVLHIDFFSAPLGADAPSKKTRSVYTGCHPLSRFSTPKYCVAPADLDTEKCWCSLGSEVYSSADYTCIPAQPSSSWAPTR